ncbi:MAG: diaminopropionate ammonia-lyase [Bacteroidales bacterium]|nr:diaminopropionate ammonia-lyase [Anaerotignum sp.]MCI5679834.1 diaminopropionate ammonia-lyase [Bacteroidales bacterium]MDY3927676.1 diaminopropionate ammonia-lyase [Anaerotignum sp.]
MERKNFDLVWNEKAAERREDISFFNVEEAGKARKFHNTFSMYQETPLVSLQNLAEKLQVKSIYLKDESKRFGLNAFKVLGASYAIANEIGRRIGKEITELSAESILSKETKEKIGDITFVTATDGNHGRGVAWTANKLGQKSVVYMPKGSALERLENIRAEGAEAEITDMNYDDAVRLAQKMAEEKGWIVVQDTAWEGYEDIPRWIMQGYTTMGHEIMEQIPEKPTHIFLQAGVGSMAGAMTGFFSNLYKEDKPIIVIVEPAKADCLFQTAKADDGKLHTVTGDMDTIMAGLACGEPCTIGWDVLKGYADAFIRCPEYAAADGMRILASPVKGDTAVTAGESGAAAFGCMANILMDQDLAEWKKLLKLDGNAKILCISTEGDTDQKNYQDVVWGGKYAKYSE